MATYELVRLPETHSTAKTWSVNLFRNFTRIHNTVKIFAGSVLKSYFHPSTKNQKAEVMRLSGCIDVRLFTGRQ